MSTTPLTAAQAGLVSCETCGLLLRPADPAEPGYCPRCGDNLEWRHHHSIQYTWALLIAAAICFIPANVLPVMAGQSSVPSMPKISWGVWCFFTLRDRGRWR